MEKSPFDNDNDSDKLKATKAEVSSSSDDDDDEEDNGIFKRVISKSEKKAEKKPDQNEKNESDKKESSFERFKKSANTELEPDLRQDVDDEGLTSEERLPAVKAVAGELADQIPEYTNIDQVSPEVAADIASKDFLEDLAETGDIEESASKQMAELDLDPARVAELEKEEPEHLPTQPDSESELEPDIEQGEDQEPNHNEELDGQNSEIEQGPEEQSPNFNEEVFFDRTQENNPDSDPEDASASKAGGSSGGTPPPTSFGPNSAPEPHPSHFRPRGLSVPQTAFGAANVPFSRPNASPNISPSSHLEDRPNPAVMALMGGIIGYYIGRRRGRIRTEKKLLPIQKKLEHQVEDLHWEIKRKDIAIRKAAAEKARQQGKGRAFVETIVATRLAKNEKQKEQQQEKQKEVQKDQQQLEQSTIVGKVERRPAAEAKQLHNSTEAQGHIGHVLVTSESTPSRLLQTESPQSQIESRDSSLQDGENLPAASILEEAGGLLAGSITEGVEKLNKSKDSSPEEGTPFPLPIIESQHESKENPKLEKKKNDSAEGLQEALSQKHVETLSRNELLLLSEKIIVDGSSLRKIYETHLVGERGLRRMVSEYLRGGDVKKALRREIVEHEIDFERDPAVRDATVPTSMISGSSTPTTKTVLDKMVEQASAGLGGDENAMAYYKARAAYEAQEQKEQKSKRRVVDVTFAGTISVLTALVIVLLLTRH